MVPEKSAFHHIEELGWWQRLIVFVVYTQVVQALMSYDGGATQFCTFALARAGWSPLWLGLLGAMDKFGQVATAFVWGGVLMRHDTKPLLVVGLFWKAVCCFLFGKLQEQPVTVVMQLMMLLAKLGMGVTEALVSVWATVWVQRNAPHDAKARWLGFAGTSAGIGNGLGSGVASLWNPIDAFFLQAFMLLAIWASLLMTPARYFRFGGPGEPAEPDSEQDEAEDMPMPKLQFGSQMLVQEVVRELAAGRPENIVAIESVQLPGHYLDASDEPLDHGFKVRITKAEPDEGTWAQFRMVQVPENEALTTFESVRLPGHFLDVSAEPLHWLDQRVKVRVTEPQDDVDFSSMAWAHFRVRSAGSERGLFHIESERIRGHYLRATGEKLKWGTRVCMTKDDPSLDNWGLFKITDMTGNYTGPVPVDFCSEATLWGRLTHLLRNRIWLFTAMVISLNCFVTSGIAFLWQNTIENVWDFGNGWSFLLFITSTGVGGLVGVVVGPNIFDQMLGGFVFPQGKAICLLWAKRMTFFAALAGTACTVLLIGKAARLVYSNERIVEYWQLGVLVSCIFLIFFFVNAITGMLYGINTDSVSEEARTFAAGLTVSFQNVFGFAFGPLLPSFVSEIVGSSVRDFWPQFPWNQTAVDGARYAAGMSFALVATWLMFFFARKAAVSARLAHISLRTFRSGLSEPLTPNCS